MNDTGRLRIDRGGFSMWKWIRKGGMSIIILERTGVFTELIKDFR
jgi:hypothetical protein